ncbi:response regulator [Rhodopirellula sp. JC740]|uniref:histidine kinase n=1 Tax=Rhodopirellula halodulae TaxID=2894198 RepID=A0ABS8NBY8_9BACT|nr:hybrid sensor histidine kinase/response regulator [Rhodopirellula sp. JC740]MCC9641072.1 response regulator [Rhodopirellula sp. JC740]
MRGSRRAQHILLIDDSADDRAKIRSALVQGDPTRRYRFREATNGEEGLRICRETNDPPIDCVIVDMQMPRVNGPEFLRALKGDDDYPQLPVVVLTGSSSSRDSGDALQQGAQDYVTKDSIYPSVLFRVVDNAIERHQLLRELNESRLAANQANQAKSAMIGNISHEIRTPMTAVLGLCDVLLEQDPSDHQSNLLQMIRENGEYLVEIVNDLLDLSKLEAGGVTIDREPMLLRHLFSRTVGLMQVRAKENETTLSLEMADDVPEAIVSDSVRIRQVFLNLASNAIKFSPGASVRVRVGTKASVSDETKLFVEVIDSGVGIPNEDIERIFQPFVQSESKKRAKSVGGTGLGLAISRRLIEMLDGKLNVTSEVGQGSTFAFEFPCEVCDPSRVESVKNSTRLSKAVEELLDGCEILVAEDTRATQVLLAMTLQSVGCVVTMVQNGHELLENYHANPGRYRAILTDIQMPGMDGLEATERLRQAGCQLPIVVLTADAVGATRREAESAGATDILTKPIDRQALLEVMARHCEAESCEESS